VPRRKATRMPPVEAIRASPSARDFVDESIRRADKRLVFHIRMIHRIERRRDSVINVHTIGRSIGENVYVNGAIAPSTRYHPREDKRLATAQRVARESAKSRAEVQGSRFKEVLPM